MVKAVMAKGAAQRWSVAARVVAGTLGAYGVTALATAALSLALARLGVVRTEAVIGATLASFAIFAGVAMAAFHARSAARAWLWLAAAAIPLALAGWLLAPAA